MEKEKYSIAIIGGGLAGITAAIEATKLGMKIIFFEKEELGGLAFNGGDVVLNHLFKKLKKPFNNPNEVKQDIINYVGNKREQYKKEYLDLLKNNDNFKIVHAKAILLDKNTVLAEGVSYFAHHIILAHGAKLNIPEIKGISEGLQSNFVKTAKNIMKHSLNEKKIAIYGGGKVAVEFAHFTSNIDIETYVLVRSDFLKDLDNDAKIAYLKLISKPNLHFIEEAEIIEINDKTKTITYIKNNKVNYLEVDSLLIAIGSIPNFEVTNKLELLHNDNGFIVSEYMETSIPNIYAVGDTNHLPKYSNLAISEAIIAVRHITFDKIAYDHTKLIKNSLGLIQYSFIGRTEKELNSNNIPYEKKVYELDSQTHNLYFFKILIHKTTREILRILLISKDSNKDLNDVVEMLDNELKFMNNNKNNLFSDSYQINTMLYQSLIKSDEDLINNNHEVVYQVKVAAKSYKPIGMELLSRFKIDNEYTNPLPFINLFEKHSTITKLDLKMLDDGAKALRALKDKNLVPDDFKASINFSPSTINRINPRRFIKILEKYHIEPNSVIIELTERMIGNKKIKLEHLNELKQYGFNLSMDDFSIGNSSLNLLNEINFDEVKLDMSLLPQKADDFDKITTFDNIVKLVTARKKSIIVEGVETPAQVKFLDQRNLTGYQGYNFHRPVSFNSLIEFLKKY